MKFIKENQLEVITTLVILVFAALIIQNLGLKKEIEAMRDQVKSVNAEMDEIARSVCE